MRLSSFKKHVGIFVGRLTFVGLSVAACNPNPMQADSFQATPHPMSISGDYTLSGTSSVADGDVKYAITITNRTSATQTVTYSGCWMYLRLFSDSSRTTPVYDASTLRSIDCVARGWEQTIPPNASAQITGDFSIGAILGAGVPPGRYYVSYYLAPNGSAQSVQAGTIDLRL